MPTVEAVTEAIGRALGLTGEAALPAPLFKALRARDTLLVLDNSESVACEAVGQGAPADQVTTDEQGRYELRLRPGRYRTRVWAAGERIGDERVIATTENLTLAERERMERIVRAG